MENQNSGVKETGINAVLLRFRRHRAFIHIYASIWSLSITGIIAVLLSAAK